MGGRSQSSAQKKSVLLHYSPQAVLVLSRSLEPKSRWDSIQTGSILLRTVFLFSMEITLDFWIMNVHKTPPLKPEKPQTHSPQAQATRPHVLDTQSPGNFGDSRMILVRFLDVPIALQLLRNFVQCPEGVRGSIDAVVEEYYYAAVSPWSLASMYTACNIHNLLPGMTIQIKFMKK